MTLLEVEVRYDFRGIGEYSSAQHLLEGEAGALQLFAREASALNLFVVLPLELSSASALHLRRQGERSIAAV